MVSEGPSGPPGASPLRLGSSSPQADLLKEYACRQSATGERPALHRWDADEAPLLSRVVRWITIADSMRKPGEPIYLRKHVLAVTVAILATVVLPRVYELVAGPMSLEARFLSGVAIAGAAGVALYRLFRGSAANEPERKE